MYILVVIVWRKSIVYFSQHLNVLLPCVIMNKSCHKINKINMQTNLNHVTLLSN